MAYRWNLSDFATGYDAAAHIIHPHYLAIQDAILDLLPNSLNDGGLVVDLGGGSGRLAERILDAFPDACAVVVDQSEPFLALAERRLARFDERAWCIKDSLQAGLWSVQIPGSPKAFVSMSAIHHLDPAEKQTLYKSCYDLLQPGGVLLNGDEIRAEPDATYLATLTHWADYMRRHMASGEIPATFHDALHGWIDRNVTRFGQEKKPATTVTRAWPPNSPTTAPPASPPPILPGKKTSGPSSAASNESRPARPFAGQRW